MNWWPSGFLPVIYYASASGAELQENAILTENNNDILTENNSLLLTEN